MFVSSPFNPGKLNNFIVGLELDNFSGVLPDAFYYTGRNHVESSFAEVLLSFISIK